ncbi:helix-turn-helix domain-containing protein [Thermobacillus sp. ZCTH02-B1]|uniref:helix-turn-helix domain-containing protein n=1 Tax=Thermobacillus sp. ZCTH02-B1 TaxID=1858795 RepID=UPI0025EF2C80|nr:helix-turn-helix domain-containing protein [Thermobacillus sp. ZCTH02-B1]
MAAAQSGDQHALMEIVRRFDPLIKKVKRKMIFQEREDLEQEIVEKLIRVILAYDINVPADFTSFRKCIREFVREAVEIRCPSPEETCP